jgi:hypothetical protein
MGRLIVFFLLILKHGLLANGVDVGYSESRRHTASLPIAWLHLSYQVLLEAIGTLALLTIVCLCLQTATLWRWETMVIAEVLGQIVAWGAERRADIDSGFSRHVIAELSFLGLYCLLVIALYPF